MLRLLTAAIAIPVIYWFIWFAPELAFQCLIFSICVLSAIEFAAMMFKGAIFRSWTIITPVALFAAHAWLPKHVPALASEIESMLVIFGALLLGLARPSEVLESPKGYAWLGLGPLFIYLSCRAIIDMHQLPLGAGWVMLSLTLAWVADSAAYFAGKRLGKHPLAPQVSPSKTIEGSIAGLFGSLFAACVAKLWYLPALTWIEVAAIGIFVGMLGQLGDLSESLIKRVAGQKDSGAILPGHGGMFDRVDSFLFSSVALWLYAGHLR